MLAQDLGKSQWREIWVQYCAISDSSMMMSSNGNIFRVTGRLCGEFTGHRWISHTKASDAELWWLFDLRLNKRLSKQSWGGWFETPSYSLWRQCNVKGAEATPATFEQMWLKHVFAFLYHEDVMAWKPFLCYWPFVGVIQQSPVYCHHKNISNVSNLCSDSI